MNQSLAQTENFIVRYDKDNKNNIHIHIEGLGVVTINRTHEGLIVDAFDLTDRGDSLATICLMDTDFEESYADEVDALITCIDYTQDVSDNHGFTSQAYQDGLDVVSAVDSWFSDHCFNADTLIGLEGINDNILAESMTSSKPHMPISDESYIFLKSFQTKYFKNSLGKVFSLGGNAGKYVVMTLS